jgi:hypothetical protein
MPGSRTPDKTAGGHCTVDDILDYLTDPADESGDHVETHLGDCARCADLFGHVSRVFLLVDNWNTTVHGELAWKLAILKALEEAPRRLENHKWAGELSRWVKKFSGRVQAVLGVSVDSSREGSLSFLGERKGLLAAGGWEFVPAVMSGGGAIRIAGVRGIPEARVELRIMAPSSSGGMPVVEITLPREVGAGVDGTLVLLVPRNRPELAKIQPLRRQSDGSWYAEFGGIETGSYLVVLEPLEPSES